MRLAEYAKVTLKGAYRRSHLAPDLKLGDALWYILLDLFVSATEGRTVTVSNACGASNLPHTTGLRHINHLLELGYLACDRDSDDARRKLVTLTDRGRQFVAHSLEGELDSLSGMNA
ncbi:MAG: winged helix DNA-binding protein [Pseudomonadota bacterium]